MNNLIKETIKDLESRGLESKRLDLESRIKLVRYLVPSIEERIYKDEDEFMDRPYFLCFAIERFLIWSDMVKIYDLIHTLSKEVTPTLNFSSVYATSLDVNDTKSVVTMWLCLPELLEYYPKYHLGYALGWFMDNYDRLSALKNIQYLLEEKQPIGQ